MTLTLLAFLSSLDYVPEPEMPSMLGTPFLGYINMCGNGFTLWPYLFILIVLCFYDRCHPEELVETHDYRNQINKQTLFKAVTCCDLSHYSQVGTACDSPASGCECANVTGTVFTISCPIELLGVMIGLLKTYITEEIADSRRHALTVSVLIKIDAKSII